jgi:hypothetical protein
MTFSNVTCYLLCFWSVLLSTGSSR